MPIDASLANAPEALIEDVQWKRAARKPPSPVDLEQDARRGDIAASFRGLAATPFKGEPKE